MHLTDITDSFLAAGPSAADAPEPGHDAFAEDRPRGCSTPPSPSGGGTMNQVNRAVGQPDLHPVVNTARPRDKLGFALHGLATRPAA